MSSEGRNRRGTEADSAAERTPRLASLLPYASEIGPLGYVVAIAGLAILFVSLGTLIIESPRQPRSSVYTPVAELSFADPVLRECVLAEAARNGWTVSGDVRSLRCNNPDTPRVAALSGIGNLINLSNVDLAQNALDDTTPLASLTRLETLDLGYNEISVPDLRGASLKSLKLDHNRLTTLDWVRDLPQLVSLSVGHNEIGTIDALASLRQLRMVNLRHNKVRDLGPLAGLSRLEVLILEANHISDVSPLSGLDNLLVLELAGNDVSDVGPLAELEQLIEVDVADNPVSRIR